MSPMSWKSGSQETKTGLSLCPMARAMSSRLCRRLAWLSITPFGLPVEPEVYWRKARSSGVMSG